MQDTRFEFVPTEIPEVVLVIPKLRTDDRGTFMETYRGSDFEAAGIGPFVQDNAAHSRTGVLRGLHYQRPPAGQGKLVRCSRGSIFDVAVDVRIGSPTYGRSVSATLDEDNRHMLYVPEGFAHGYCVLGESADVAYKVSAEYAPDLADGIRWDDPALGIDWPLSEPVVSEFDARLPTLADAADVFSYGGV